VQSVNGALYDSQRFAIDYMRLNAAVEFVHGDTTDVHNYVAYGADVIVDQPQFVGKHTLFARRKTI